MLAPVTMRDIGPAQVREWITALTARGASARRIEYSKNSVLGAIFAAAVEDGVIVPGQSATHSYCGGGVAGRGRPTARERVTDFLSRYDASR